MIMMVLIPICVKLTLTITRHDTERALNTWHTKQVMGSANMALADTTHMSNVSVTAADIKTWRASNAECSEWMTDANIE